MSLYPQGRATGWPFMPVRSLSYAVSSSFFIDSPILLGQRCDGHSACCWAQETGDLSCRGNERCWMRVACCCFRSPRYSNVCLVTTRSLVAVRTQLPQQQNEEAKMKKREFQAAVQRLADDAGLRSVQSRARPGKTWVGICQGISVVMNLDSVRLQLELTSPEQPRESESSTDLSSGESEQLEASTEAFAEGSEDADFCRAARAGFPADWFEQYAGELWGFQLTIDDARRRSLSPETFDGLLHRIAQDMHDLGAEATLPCVECQRPATTLGFFEHSFSASVTPYCTACWEAVRQATRGVVHVGGALAVRKAWAFLAFASFAVMAVWGVAQHPAWGIPLPVLWLGSAGIGFGLAVATSSIAGGSTLSLRIGLAAAVLAGMLGGNILGYKFLLETQRVIVPWSLLVSSYFTAYFPAQLGQELLLMAGGLVGGGIGLLVLRDSERMRVQ